MSVLAFCWYCQPLMSPSPVTDEVRVSLPEPALVATVGVPALPGLVRNADAVAITVEQVLSLYAL